MSDFENVSNCVQAKVYESQPKGGIDTSTPLKSQIVIIGNEMPLFSDDLSNIDICMKSSDESVEECPHEKKPANISLLSWLTLCLMINMMTIIVVLN